MPFWMMLLRGAVVAVSGVPQVAACGAHQAAVGDQVVARARAAVVVVHGAAVAAGDVALVVSRGCFPGPCQTAGLQRQRVKSAGPAAGGGPRTARCVRHRALR